MGTASLPHRGAVVLRLPATLALLLAMGVAAAADAPAGTPAAGVPAAVPPAATAPAAPRAPAGPYVLSTGGTLTAPATEVPGATGERLAASLGGSVPPRCEGGAVLAEGDLVVGWPSAFQAGVLTIASGAFGELTIPAAQLAAIVISPVPTAAPVEVPPGFSGAVLANGERVAGTPSFLNVVEAGIDTGKRVVQIPRARVASLVLRPPAPPAKPVVRLRLATGDLVSGAPLAKDGAWTLRHPCGELAIPQRAVRGWWSEGPDRLPLTALLPQATYAEKLDPPLLPLTGDRQSDGGWLTVSGVRCDRGLAMRVGTTATATLPAGAPWRALVAVLAVTRGGNAVFSVTGGDGQKLYTSPPLGPRSAAVPIAVPLNGAKAVSLTVAAAQDGDLPATVTWGWATVVR